MQELIVAAIVIASAGYAAWSLMPAGWRNALRRRLGKAPAPTSGCGGCGGCGSDATAAKPASAVITLHRRPPPA